MTEAVLHYNQVARTLHWTIGTIIILNILIGIFHDPIGEVFKSTMTIHKSLGFTVLVLTLARLAWRFTHPAPPLPASMAGWEKFSAHAVHWIFYAFMIILPMTGWAFSSAGKYPLTFFGLFDIPKLDVAPKSGLQMGTHNAHVVFGYSWAVLLLVHIGAALRHQFMLKDNVLNRIWLGAPGKV